VHGLSRRLRDRVSSDDPKNLIRLGPAKGGSGKSASTPFAGVLFLFVTEKGRSGLYSSTKSPGSISLRNGHDEALDARPGFEGERSSQEIFPPQSRPDLPFSVSREVL